MQTNPLMSKQTKSSSTDSQRLLEATKANNNDFIAAFIYAATLEVMADKVKGKKAIENCMRLLLGVPSNALSQTEKTAQLEQFKIDSETTVWLNGVAIAACAHSVGMPHEFMVADVGKIAVKAGVSTTPNIALSVALLLRTRPVECAVLLNI